MRNLQLRYPGQIDTSDPVGFPYGKAKNVVVKGDGTGTPWESDLVNDFIGFMQALAVAGHEVPGSFGEKVGDSQLLNALRSLGLSGPSFTRRTADVGPVPYAPVSNVPLPLAAFDGTNLCYAIAASPRVKRYLTPDTTGQGGATIGVSNMADLLAAPGRLLVWDSAAGGTFVSTNSGLTWSAGGSAGANFTYGAYFAGPSAANLFVLAGTNQIKTSPTGTTWTTRTPASTFSVQRVLAGPNECLITHWSGGNGEVQRSTDGIAWSLSSLPSSVAGPDPRILLGHYNRVQKRWLAYADNTDTFWASPTGQVWTETGAIGTADPFSGRVKDLISFGRYWVALEAGGTPYVTADGTTWQRLNTATQLLAPWTKVVDLNGQLVLMGFYDGNIEFAYTNQLLRVF